MGLDSDMYAENGSILSIAIKQTAGENKRRGDI
jgi:hypothetical protein